MTYPAAELQKGIYEALVAYAPLAELMGGAVRAFDRVDPAFRYPYLTIGADQTLDGGNTCEPDMYEVFAEVHVWSQAVGKVEAKRITERVREVLGVPFGVDGWTVTAAELRDARHTDDANGITAHSILTFRYLLEPAG